MSWVAIGTAAFGAVASVASKKSGPSQSGGSMGGPSFFDPSAATYGTQIGNDGWSINFGSGNQTANPSETNSASYPTQQNPLSAVQPVQMLPQPVAASGIGGFSAESIALLGVGTLVAIKLARG